MSFHCLHIVSSVEINMMVGGMVWLGDLQQQDNTEAAKGGVMNERIRYGTST